MERPDDRHYALPRRLQLRCPAGHALRHPLCDARPEDNTLLRLQLGSDLQDGDRIDLFHPGRAVEEGARRQADR